MEQYEGVGLGNNETTKNKYVGRGVTQEYLKMSLPCCQLCDCENNEILYTVVDACKDHVLSVTFHYLI